MIFSGSRELCKWSILEVMQPGSKTIIRAVPEKFSSKKLLAMGTQQLIFEMSGEKF
ncbi:MAG: hypothetical protein LBC11_00095 [Puniceicoccales bacterium]|nr:hypothetical protein [Puniceicoccales bacterium]